MEVSDGQRPTVARPGREGFRPLQFLRCLFMGHVFRTSRTYDNCKTCNRCKHRIRG